MALGEDPVCDAIALRKEGGELAFVLDVLLLGECTGPRDRGEFVGTVDF